MKKKWWTYQELVDNDLLNTANQFHEVVYYSLNDGTVFIVNSSEYGDRGLSYPTNKDSVPITPNINNFTILYYGPYNLKQRKIPEVPKKLDKRIKDQMIIENIIK